MTDICYDKYFTKVIVTDANNTNFTKPFETTLRAKLVVALSNNCALKTLEVLGRADRVSPLGYCWMC